MKLDATIDYQLPEIEINYTPTRNRIKVQKSKQLHQVFKSIWDTNLLNVQEQCYALFLNSSNEIIGWRLISTGSTTSILIDFKLIAAIACKSLASGVAIAHNHPSGKPIPSGSDKELTVKLQDALELLNIELIDHIIITKDGYSSFAEEGLLIP